jgi:hypothetical protein
MLFDHTYVSIIALREEERKRFEGTNSAQRWPLAVDSPQARKELFVTARLTGIRLSHHYLAIDTLIDLFKLHAERCAKLILAHISFLYAFNVFRV